MLENNINKVRVPLLYFFLQKATAALVLSKKVGILKQAFELCPVQFFMTLEGLKGGDETEFLRYLGHCEMV